MSRNLFLILLILCLTVVRASAHDWYDYSCCSKADCHPISCEDIMERGKYLIYQGHEFIGDMIKSSKDGDCHVCIQNEFSKEYSPRPRCIYVQQGS